MFVKIRAYYLLIGLFCFTITFSLAQDQRVADSLTLIYHNNDLIGIDKLELLKDLCFNELNNLTLRVKYAEELIELSLQYENKSYLYDGYYLRGNSYALMGETEKALNDFFTSTEIAIEEKDFRKEGTSYMSIAGVYNRIKNHDNSETYYSKAIDKLRQTNDSTVLASALLNAGDAAINNKKYDKAITYFEESNVIFKNLNHSIGIAYNNGNLGIVYAEQGKDSLAEKKINEAILVLEEIKDYYPISVYLTYMSDIYIRKNDWKIANNYAQRSLELAQKYNLKEQIRDANLKLSELYQKKGDFKTSLLYINNYYKYRDSIINIESVERIADLRTNFEVSQKQIEVDLLDEKQQKQRLTIIATIIALILITILTIVLFRRNLFIKKTRSIIQKERDLSNKLLRNILPEETAKELIKNGKVKPQKINHASVLFTDFKGFTKLSENLSPEQLVESVNFYYSKFDEIVEKYGLEKIKTIGDAYMVAGGLPFPTQDHALKIVEAAFEISKFVEEAKMDDTDHITHFDIRIGVNSGPVVAGVVGINKFAYDIWGDTVNIASRMESNSEAGKINVSKTTYELIRHKFECTYRGEIETKNRGKLKMYFVDGLKATPDE